MKTYKCMMVVLMILALLSQQSICAAYMFAGSQNNNNNQGTIPAAAVQNFAKASAGSFFKPAALSVGSNAPSVMASAARFNSSTALQNTGMKLFQQSFSGIQSTAPGFSATTHLAAASASPFNAQFPAAGGNNTVVQSLKPESIPELFSALQTLQQSEDQVTGTVKEIVDTAAEVFEKETNPLCGTFIYDADGNAIGEYKEALNKINSDSRIEKVGETDAAVAGEFKESWQKIQIATGTVEVLQKENAGGLESLIKEDTQANFSAIQESIQALQKEEDIEFVATAKERFEQALATVKEEAQYAKENIEKAEALHQEEIQLLKQEPQGMMENITAAVQAISVNKGTDPIVGSVNAAVNELVSKAYAPGDSRWAHVIDHNGRLSWPDSSRGMSEPGRKYTCMLTPLSKEEKAQYYAYIGR